MKISLTLLMIILTLGINTEAYSHSKEHKKHPKHKKYKKPKKNKYKCNRHHHHYNCFFVPKKIDKIIINL